MWQIGIEGPTYDYRDYVRFLADLNSGLSRSADHFVVDLSRVEFSHPDGMAPLIATINHLVRQGLRIQVVPPVSDDQVTYWEKAGWIAGLRGDEPPGLDRRSSFLPLTPYEDSVALNAFLTEALHLLAESDVFPAGVLDAFAWAINEIADNVLVHAESEEPGWLQLTTYRQKGQIEFVVVDTGQGVLSSLQPAFPTLRTDTEALIKAVEKGVRRSRRTQGNGLSGTLRIATNAKGWINLQSGTGQLRVLEGQMYHQDVARHHGMVVAMTLPTRAPIDLASALWGHIPMPAFEMDYLGEHGVEFRPAAETSNLGNRATGERMRTKVMNLMHAYPEEPIVIDFEGVEIVSASFADEFIAKMVQEMGPMQFFGRFRFRNTTGFVAQTIDRVIEQRLTAG